MNLKNLLFIILLTFSTNLFAQPISEGVESIGLRNLQVEPSFLVTTTIEDISRFQQIVVPTALLRYGVSNAIELRAQSQFEILDMNEGSLQGIGDLFLGAKYQLDYNQSTKSQLAFMTTLLIPSGMPELSNERYGTINTVIFQKDFQNENNLLLNLSHSYLGESRGDLNYSLLMSKGINNELSIYLELFGDLVDFEDLYASLDAGMSVAVSDRLGLEFTLGAGLNHKMNFISLGFTYLIISNQNALS